MENTNYLAHYGVMGMKWGVRRYQNPDGTLTDAGRARYGTDEIDSKPKVSHKELKTEHSRLEKQYKESDSRNEEKEKLVKEAWEIADKYGLDADDGGGGDTSKFSEEELSKAAEKYLQKWEDYEHLDEAIKNDSYTKAEKALIDKYGKERIDSYHTRNNVETTAKIIAAFTLPIAALVLIGDEIDES